MTMFAQHPGLAYRDLPDLRPVVSGFY